MFKIGDFSKLGQVSVRMLRHYDKLNLLGPSHTDQWTGYRYYTIDQLARLNRIVSLNGLGLTLSQIADLLATKNAPSLEQLRGMLLLRHVELEQELQEKQFQLLDVEARLRQIEYEGQVSSYEIVVKAVDSLSVASLRQIVPTIDQMGYYCHTLYEQLYIRLAAHSITPAAPELTLYHTDEYTETDLDVETAVHVGFVGRHAPVDDALVFHQLPAEPLVAALIYEGAYADVGPAVLALLEWIGTHNHTVAGPLRELHLSGPAHVGGVLQATATLELQVPIRPLGD